MKEKINRSRLAKSLKWGVIAGLVITIISFLISIVACLKQAGIGVCVLPSPFSNMVSLDNIYYGISNNPLSGLLMQFLIPLILVFIIAFGSKKKTNGKIVDYTKK